MTPPTGTASSRNPHPVLIHLVETSRIPNLRRMDIARCHVTGAGYGQLASERAHVRLERIACVLRSGDVIDTKIKGYVAGEDGKTGIRGRLVSKQGKKYSLAGFWPALPPVSAGPSKARTLPQGWSRAERLP